VTLISSPDNRWDGNLAGQRLIDRGSLTKIVEATEIRTAYFAAGLRE